MRWVFIVRDVIARSLCQREGGTVLMLYHQLTCDNEDDMAFVAPMVCKVIRAIGDKPELNVSQVLRTNNGSSRLARMGRFQNLRPFDGASR